MKKQIKFHVRFETSILPRYPKITLILLVYFNNNNRLIFTIHITSQFLINRSIEEKIISINTIFLFYLFPSLPPLLVTKLSTRNQHSKLERCKTIVPPFSRIVGMHTRYLYLPLFVVVGGHRSLVVYPRAIKLARSKMQSHTEVVENPCHPPIARVRNRRLIKMRSPWSSISINKFHLSLPPLRSSFFDFLVFASPLFSSRCCLHVPLPSHAFRRGECNRRSRVYRGKTTGDNYSRSMKLIY